MKKSVLFILLFISTHFTAQVKATDTDFILKAGSVSWQHQYVLENKSTTDLLALIETKFSGQEHYFKNAKQVTFDIKDDKPNLKKLGAKETKTSIVAQLYMKYNVVIDIQDNQYTVTLKQIFLDNKDATERQSGEISKFICNISNLTFKTDPGIQKALVYDHLHFLEKFDITIKEETNGKR